MSSTETLFAVNGLAQLAARIAALGGKQVLVLCTASRRHVDDLLAALHPLETTVFAGARVHVPADVVDAAAAQLIATRADTIVAIGGGSAIGLGKALRISHEVRFVAIPTTYAGSEMTSMYGVTRGRDKQTGRDDRVRPDLVLYDVALTDTMPLPITVQSLCNSIAHVASVMSTRSSAGQDRHDALAGEALASTIRAIEDLLVAPRAPRAREQALRAASGSASALDRGTAGAQHQLAHLIGGALDVDHAALHAALLPQFLAHVRAAAPATYAWLEQAAGRSELDAYVHDLLVRAGSPVSLSALGITGGALREALARRPELPAQVALDALVGLRPPGEGGRIDLGLAQAVLAGPRPERARRIVLALHGRGAEAGTILRRLREITGHEPTTSVIGLRAAEAADRWYGVKYNAPGASADPEVTGAIARVESAIAELRRIAPTAAIVLAGFSQGACLALEVAARHTGSLASVIAPCGARIGAQGEWSAPVQSLTGVPILLGAAEADAWVPVADIAATAAWFRAAGATVDVVGTQGARHEITLLQRMRARELALGVTAPRGGTGFGNTLESEAIAGALPTVQNSPRLAPFGLYPEQINGTGFTAPRADNLRTWLYRVRPSAQRRAFGAFVQPRIVGVFDGAPVVDLCGFPALPAPADERDFVDSLTTVCGAGSASLRRGYAFHVYGANRSMDGRAFYNADGDLAILPDLGAVTLMTELGPLELEVGQLAIIPRGIAFSMLLRTPFARGYVAEAFGRHFRLPDRGPVGANGLADARHFRAPAAWFEDRLAPGFEIVAKLGGRMHLATQDHSPYDVVAWHGNYAPSVYDLAAFSPSGNTRFDHGDPSIYTVISAPLDEHGSHTLDLVVFPPRWDATMGTFRPPFFHRNVTSEINGILRETPTRDSPFQAGVSFITPSLTAHGVSGTAVEQSRMLDDTAADLPHRPETDSLWFQLESALPPVLTAWAETQRVADWAATWGSHPSYFTRERT